MATSAFISQDTSLYTVFTLSGDWQYDDETKQVSLTKGSTGGAYFTLLTVKPVCIEFTPNEANFTTSSYYVINSSNVNTSVSNTLTNGQKYTIPLPAGTYFSYYANFESTTETVTIDLDVREAYLIGKSDEKFESLIDLTTYNPDSSDYYKWVYDKDTKTVVSTGLSSSGTQYLYIKAKEDIIISFDMHWGGGNSGSVYLGVESPSYYYISDNSGVLTYNVKKGETFYLRYSRSGYLMKNLLILDNFTIKKDFSNTYVSVEAFDAVLRLLKTKIDEKATAGGGTSGESGTGGTGSSSSVSSADLMSIEDAEDAFAYVFGTQE